MNILLIEPDKVLAQILKLAMKTDGHEVVIKRTAQSALDSLDENIPDIVVLEIQLDKHNGIEYLYELRSYSEWQAIPVIVHTKNRNVLNDDFKIIWNQAGVKEIFYKPQTTTKQLIRSLELAKIK